MNDFGVVVEEKLHVVNKPKDETDEFIMQVGVVFFHEPNARQRPHNGFQHLLGLGHRLLIPQGSNGMAIILRLSRDAVGARGAGSEPPRRHGIAS